MCAFGCFPKKPCWPMIGSMRARLASESRQLGGVVREASIMRVVLTGASGQLGAYLVEGLVRSGHQVFAWSGRETGVRCGVQLRPIDLIDQAAVGAALES